jgi:hypothetical protein
VHQHISRLPAVAAGIACSATPATATSVLDLLLVIRIIVYALVAVCMGSLTRAHCICRRFKLQIVLVTCDADGKSLVPFIKRYICADRPDDAPAALMWQGFSHFMALPVARPGDMLLCPGIL